MSFNDYEIYQMAKLRQEEIERIARDAWKYEGVKYETFFQKLVKKWSSHQKSVTVQQTCGCASQC